MSLSPETQNAINRLEFAGVACGFANRIPPATTPATLKWVGRTFLSALRLCVFSSLSSHTEEFNSYHGHLARVFAED